MSKQEFLSVGKFVGARGLNGELKVECWMDNIQDFCDLKNIFIKETETVNEGIKLLETEKQQVVQHIEKWFKIEAQQRKGVSEPFSEEELLPGLCLPSGQLPGFFSHTCPTLGHSPGCTLTAQPGWLSK